MKITEKMGQLFRTKNPEKIAEQIAKEYKEKKENGEENPIDDIVERIMNIIKANPEPKKIKELLKAVLETEEIPDRVFEKTSTKISKIDKIPDRIITDVIERSETNIPDESINRIIEEGNIDVKERINLMHNVEDRSIIEERVENELKILYKVAKNKRDDEIVTRINELKELLNDNKLSTEIQNLIQQVVAKKMAENYYSDIRKGTNVYTLSKIMPVEDMIEKDLASAVETEYRKIEEERKTKEGRFDKKGLKIQILVEMGKNIAYKYDETGVFIIPQSKNMKKIDKDEEELFIKAIQTYSRKQLSKQEIIDIDEQIRGNSNNIQIKENMLINLIKKIPEQDKNRSIDFLNKILENKENLTTLSMLDEYGLIEKFNEMPKEKREKTIASIGKVLENRRHKVAKNPPKIRNNQRINIYKRDREDR